jgi:hypothetical protein
VRTALTLPLLGAALLTLGALALRLSRVQLRPAVRQGPQSLPGPSELLERLRAKGL